MFVSIFNQYAMLTRQSGQESYIGTLHGAFISKDEEIISIFNAHSTLIITKSCIHMEQKLRNAVSILSKIACTLKF